MAKEKENAMPVKQDGMVPAVKNIELTHAQRFTNMVIKEFTGRLGSPALTQFQKRLVQNYFISIDLALRTAEEKRLKKSEAYRDKLEISWKNVNVETLAVNVVSCARIGFDPALANHISMIPFKNNTLNKYDIVFIEGYRGKEIKAKKYGFDVPDDVIVEVVYSSDLFKPIKKDKNNTVETYIFEVKEPFNRGEIVGGFYCHVWHEKPEKNKIVFYSISEILKRKPDHASVEFWGGQKPKWETDEKTGKSKKIGSEQVEGWFPEMVYKTIYRAAYSAISIDSQKIDDDYVKLSEHERIAALPVDTQSGANTEILDITDVSEDVSEIVDKTPQLSNHQQEENQPDKEKAEGEKDKDPVKKSTGGDLFNKQEGPGF
jgi:recombination protein RecT